MFPGLSIFQRFPTMDLAALTPRQRQAVTSRDGPLMVLAGPGTGKTRTLTHRLAYLVLDRGIPPENILAVTFTNQAAEEMRSRAEQLLRRDMSAAHPWITTFHGFAYRLLRQSFFPNHRLLSENEALEVLKNVFRERPRKVPPRLLNELSRRISLAKGSLLTPHEAGRLPGWEALPEWPAVYQAYQDRLSEQNSWDFDDLIQGTVRLFEDRPVFREQWQLRYPLVLVDEFQDINPAQYQLFRLLANDHGDWLVIGDPNQAIYGFRGAGANYFDRLREQIPRLTEIHLENTFRLNQTILKASSQVISAASASFPYRMKTAKIGDPTLTVAGLPSAEAEARYLAALIEKLVGGLTFLTTGLEVPGKQPVSLAEIAVLYRLHAQGEFIGRAFQEKGIPFKRVQERHWSDCPEIRQLFARLKALLPFQGTPLQALDQVMARPVQDPQGLAPESSGVLPGPSIEALKKLRLSAAAFPGGLESFLEVLSLQTGLDAYEPDQENVKLLTLHAAKGLEFRIVLLSGCEANLLPLTIFGNSDLEEERRLFYVGLTRATQNIFLSWAKKRRLLGQTLMQSPSPFLADIEENLKSNAPLPETGKPNRPNRRQLSLF
jgi:DNA helicase II / ATP-dependent DNA helicase PcrA